MNCYVKLAYGWTYIEQSNNSYMTNALDATMFALDDTNNVMAQLISKGIELNYLEQNFGEAWEVFRKALEDNYAIIYSNYKNPVIDSVDYGARMSMSSTFVRQPPKVMQLSIEVNRRCKLNCDFCGETTAFECLSCSCDALEKDICCDDAIEAIKHLSEFGIPMLLLQGGDPLLDYELIKKLVIFYKRLNSSGTAIILTNGISLLDYDEEQLRFLKKWTRLFLVAVENNQDRFGNITDLLDRKSIQYDIISRNMNIDYTLLGNTTVNNTISLTKGKQISVFTEQNIVKPYDLYNNTVKYDNSCYQGHVYMSVEGDVSICKAYTETKYNVADYSWSRIIYELKRRWHNINEHNSCGNCKLSRLCYSCEYVKELYHNSEIADNICFSKII